MLQSIEWTRERRRKDEALVKLLTAHWTRQSPPSESTLIELVKDFNSADRYWRLLTAAHEGLRGTDYDTKQIVEQRKELSLGYQPGYNQDLKVARML